MIHLHIGYPKTGTTTIQQGLLLNRIILKDQGNILYPLSGLTIYGHHNIFYDLAKSIPGSTYSDKYDKDKGGLINLLAEIAEWRSACDGDVILSSEAFFTLPEYVFKEFLASLSKVDKVSLILIVRRQDHWLRSFWAMEVSQLKTNYSFAEWIQNRTMPKRADIKATVSNFKQWCPEIELKVIGFEDLKPEGLFAGFLNSCGIPLQLRNSLSLPPIQNATLDPQGLEFMRNLLNNSIVTLPEETKRGILMIVASYPNRLVWRCCTFIYNLLYKINIIKAYNIGSNYRDVFLNMSKMFKDSNDALISEYPDLYSTLEMSNIRESKPVMTARPKLQKLFMRRAIRKLVSKHSGPLL